MALSPDGKTLYVSDNGVVWMTEDADGENTISVVDTASFRRIAVIDLGRYRRPHGITVDPKEGAYPGYDREAERAAGCGLAHPEIVRAIDVRGRRRTWWC